jgi:hypothetical protein
VKYVSTDTPSKLNSSECGNTIDIFVYLMEWNNEFQLASVWLLI